jgi:hypothetical protein
MLFGFADVNGDRSASKFTYTMTIGVKYFGGWRHYQGVILPGDRKIDVLIKPDEDMGCAEVDLCFYIENFFVELPVDYVLSGRKRGLEFQINSEKSTTHVKLPPSLTREFLATVDKQRRGKKSSAPKKR